MTRKQLGALVAPVSRDLTGIAGAGLIVLGVWEMFRPAGLIVAGLMMVTAAILWARRQ